MDRTQLQNAIANVKPGQKLKLRFNEEAKRGGLNYFFRLGLGDRMIEIDPTDIQTLRIVLQYADWNKESNKMAQITVLDTFDQQWFVYHMYRELDSIEVLN